MKQTFVKRQGQGCCGTVLIFNPFYVFVVNCKELAVCLCVCVSAHVRICVFVLP
uniref:Uncharacterized protein n=1 Tax=Anguilla anguilla TaxID=7936 RepID=A0A0E9Q153_ANGAN